MPSIGSPSAVPTAPAVPAGRTRSESVDAEEQRRRQGVVRITHYLKYSPRGWIHPTAPTTGLGKALGLAGAQSEAPVFPFVLPPGAKESLAKDIVRLVSHLDTRGAPPTVMWSRNANIYDTEQSADEVRISYRLASWGVPSSSSSSSSSLMTHGRAESEGDEFVEIEVRIEHRVWAYGERAADGEERTMPASVEVTVEPFLESSAIACFVDPEADPHATRVWVRHRRSLFAPQPDKIRQILEWPTAAVVVRRQRITASSAVQAASRAEVSSLVVPAEAENPMLLPWSVPPRIVVNGAAAARVRYLRRDAHPNMLYARCQSIAAHDQQRILRSRHVPFVEPLPAAAVADSSAANSIARSVRSGSNADSTALSGHVLIRNYSVGTGLGSVAANQVTPGEFAQMTAACFASLRHEIEALDETSARARLVQAHMEGVDERASLMTAQETDGGGWASYKRHGLVDVYERIVESLHAEVPVTVAVGVLQGVGVEDVAMAMKDRSAWDSALFADLRELEYVLDDDIDDENSNMAGVSINYSHLNVPLLCSRRDALTVSMTQMAPFLPARKQLRQWQRSETNECGDLLGDYFDQTVTLVEASVPGSQPLASIARAHVPLYAVRIDPIDGFERAAGHNYAFPSCRVTIACCVDLAGSVPVALRRAYSAAIPEQHLSALFSRAKQPLPPCLVSPTRMHRVGLRSHDEVVVGEVSEENDVVFYRSFSARRVGNEDFEYGAREYSVALCLPKQESESEPESAPEAA
ncbi:hypothetical protein FBU59_002807, partial [Linderina macrospora]